MMSVPRTDNSIFGRWWWTVDRWSMAALLLLSAVGAVLVMAASPSVADRMQFNSFHFVHRHLATLGLALILMIGVSLFSPVGVRRFAWVQFVVGLFFMFLVLADGLDINGARRWISFAGLSMQPSELVKPSFVVVTAWLLAQPRKQGKPRGSALSIGLLIIVLALLVAQPDFGMALVVGAVWFSQHFIAGMPAYALTIAIVGGVVGLIAGYFSLSHVQSRID
ncbi:MAG: FtsW/RodA/SpoVE family cell cycle protein, partial [Alphaproteobacteria bacterium]